MLTIKHISNGGDERIYEARNARLVRATPAEGSRDTLWAEFGEDRVEGTIDSGTVYVMNRHGKTVAHYIFASPVPLPPLDQTAAA